MHRFVSRAALCALLAASTMGADCHGGTGGGAALPAWDGVNIPVEVQAWWRSFDDMGIGHIHAMTSAPIGMSVDELANEWTFDYRLTVHHNPSLMNVLRLHSWDFGQEDLLNRSFDRTCPLGSTCAWHERVTHPTRDFAGGMYRLRFQGIAPDGTKWTTSTDWPYCSQGAYHGGKVSYVQCDGDETPAIFKAWYGAGIDDYSRVEVENIPRRKVSGLYELRFRPHKNTPVQWVVNLDKTHAIPAVGPFPAVEAQAGKQLYFERDLDGVGPRTVPIDTTRLADGWHSIAIEGWDSRTDSTNCGGDDDCRTVAVAKFWIWTEN